MNNRTFAIQMMMFQVGTVNGLKVPFAQFYSTELKQFSSEMGYS
jgi:hypothetical protein